MSTAGSLSEVLKKGNEPENASFSHLPWKSNLQPDPFAELKVGISWKLSTVLKKCCLYYLLFTPIPELLLGLSVVRLNLVDDDGLNTVQLHQSFWGV